MNILELLLIAVGLSMDAFAVSVCKGLAMNSSKLSVLKALTVGLYFGIFQAIMPFLGYILGTKFSEIIKNFDHWIVFILLVIIGGKMIWESLKDDGGDNNDSVKFGVMLPLALATSIDALAIGVGFALLQVDIVPAVLFIGSITLVLSTAGVAIGYVFGKKYKSQAETAGGIILILIGIKVLLEHLGVISF